MKLNTVTHLLSELGRWIATAMFCLSAIAFCWQGVLLRPATAAPLPQMIATVDAGSKAQGKASEDAGRTKNFVRDTAEQVKRTAYNNADRVEEATGNKGSFIERKAQRDAARIEKRANQDAALTQKAIDNTKNTVERTVDGIKDTFGR